MAKTDKDKTLPLAGKPKSHGTKRRDRIKTLAKQHDIPESTVIGRGLHRGRRPRPNRAPAPQGTTLATQPQPPARRDPLTVTLDELGLTVRGARDLLHDEGLTTVGLIIERSATELSGKTGIKGFGPKSLAELRRKLAELGVTLKDDGPPETYLP